jgi:hypothetical protein
MKYKGNVDPKLQAVIDLANRATDTFIEAIPTMQERMSFKAFSIGGGLTDDQKNSLLDVIMTQTAIRIKEKAPELMEQKTITSSVETGPEEFVMWLHATNEKPEPPTKEEPYASFDPKEDEQIVRPKIELIPIPEAPVASDDEPVPRAANDDTDDDDADGDAIRPLVSRRNRAPGAKIVTHTNA